MKVVREIEHVESALSAIVSHFQHVYDGLLFSASGRPTPRIHFRAPASRVLKN